MSYQKKIFIVLLCTMLLMAFCVTGALASSGVKVLNNEKFTTSTGIVKAANASSLGQSAMAVRRGADGGGYGVFYPTLTGNNPAHSFAEVNFTNTYVNSSDNIEYFILEFDFATETQYVENMEFEFIGKNASGSSVFGQTKASIITDTNGEWTLKSTDSVKLEQERGKWQHLTIIIDVVRNDSAGNGANNSVIYFYLNGELVGSGKAFKDSAGAPSYFHSLRISYLNGKPVNSTDTFCIDNLVATKITDEYSGNLAEVLADSERSLTEFDDSNYKVGYVFPKAAAIAKIGDTEYATVSDLEDAVKSGDEIVILKKVYDTFNVSCECSIYNPNGYELNYNANGFTAYESNNTISFIEAFDSVEVVWHLGNKIERVIYTEPSVATPPSYSETFEMDGVVYKAVGFSKSEGGEIVTDLGYISPHNKEFWLVYEEPIAYTVHPNGEKVYAYNCAEFDSLISNAIDGDVVKLLADAYTSAAFKINNKKVTLDLCGYILHMSEGGTGEMFTIESDAALTVKNGAIEAYRNGGIPEGSTSMVRRRLFLTSYVSSVVNVENVKINACKMIAMVKNGVASFVGCDIDVTKDYDNLIDLYSNNEIESPTTLNFENCNIKAFKTIVNVYKPSNVNYNNAVINAVNCNMQTAERVFATEAAGEVTIIGGSYKCMYLFGKLNTNTDAVAHISEGTKLDFDFIDEKGKMNFDLGDGVVAKTNDSEYPYVVTSSYAPISWVWPNATAKENWKIGEVPVCPFDIPESTREIKYELAKIVAAEKATTYTMRTAENFETKISVELGMDYSINFYVSEMNLTSLKLGKYMYTKADAKLVNIDGENYYKFNTGALTPEECIKSMTATVKVPSAFGDRQYSFSFSLISYIDEILSGAYSYDTYKLALSVLNCIKTRLPEDAATVSYDNIVKKYNTDILLTAIEDTGADIEAVSDAIDSVSLESDGVICYRLKLTTAFSGTVKIVYERDGKTVEQKCSVFNGRYGTAHHIDVYLEAWTFARGFDVVVGEKTAHVDLSILDGISDEATMAKIMAIYAYSKEVEKYVAEREDGN